MFITSNASVRTWVGTKPGARQILGPMDVARGDKGASPPAPLRILIVEDESVVAMQLEDTVQDLGHVVIDTVASHVEAVAAAESSRPDLVLMDINLGRGGNGIEAALELRRRLDLPCIFLSAYLSSPSVKERAQAVQPLGCITKPYTARHIEAALRKAAERLEPGRN